MGPDSLSIVLPCRNEERCVAACVEEARRGLAALGIEGEVVVVDNGSEDATAARARAAGARVVEEPRRGYGAAVGRGIREAKGAYVAYADADGSYPLDDWAPLLDEAKKGADLVLGSRLRGRIEPGAMPWLHRRVGTPFLTALANLLFRVRISDINSGMRLLRADAARRLDLRGAGMEFASEMVVKAALLGLAVRETPIAYRRDRRGRPPHLRRWRDGWRHLRFLLLFAPNLVFLAPGLLLFAAGAFLGAPAFLRGSGDCPAFLASGLVLLGSQFAQVGLVAKTWCHVEGFYRRPYLERLFRVVSIESGLLLSAGLLAIGVVVALPLLRAPSAGAPPEPARVASALTFVLLGAQVGATSILLSVLGIRKRP